MAELTYDQAIDILACLRFIEVGAQKYMEPTKVPAIEACLKCILDTLTPQLEVIEEKTKS